MAKDKTLGRVWPELSLLPSGQRRRLPDGVLYVPGRVCGSSPLQRDPRKLGAGTPLLCKDQPTAKGQCLPCIGPPAGPSECARPPTDLHAARQRGQWRRRAARPGAASAGWHTIPGHGVGGRGEEHHIPVLGGRGGIAVQPPLQGPPAPQASQHVRPPPPNAAVAAGKQADGATQNADFAALVTAAEGMVAKTRCHIVEAAAPPNAPVQECK